jgi:transcriptional regulator with XRE-family HTH domain
MFIMNGFFDNSAFADGLAAARKQSGLSQEKVAEKVRVHQSTYSNWEKAIRRPDIGELYKLASCFDVDVCHLIRMGGSGQDRLAVNDESQNRVTAGNGELSNMPQGRPLLKDIFMYIINWDDARLQRLLGWCQGYDASRIGE